ncbi:PA3496 family putative envelope integrity protein [Legionella waltersii]|uniref:Uncharacterized protein n=1 Tax=Legionella waltersii TaxID=66969 RepID=A0A0W1ADF7_9GAMM|nr:hypothetical protein [Legionella waltersii]KTD79369.1 hypothetical protein Lwal_1441 [Legionella waltersii]SNU99798.1 Uncharacterised protein [Legionella waltersii]
MSDIFEDDEEEVIDIGEEFEEVDVDPEEVDATGVSLDARRRLENMLEERRLREELDDFVDY